MRKPKVNVACHSQYINRIVSEDIILVWGLIVSIAFNGSFIILSTVDGLLKSVEDLVTEDYWAGNLVSIYSILINNNVIAFDTKSKINETSVLLPITSKLFFEDKATHSSARPSQRDGII